MSPSKHHAYLQANLIAALKKLPNYTVFSELTLLLKTSDAEPVASVEASVAELVEAIPDICLYPKQTINVFEEDTIKMTELPLLAIEILSPSQAVQIALDKFKMYFQAGIQSCWLVIPTAHAVIVYSSPQQAQSFNSGELIDKTLNIRISTNEIFD